MEQYNYAQIDENGKCFAVSQLGGEVLSDELIRIDSYDETFMGKQYINGEWVTLPEPEPGPPGLPPVTNEEVIQATMEVRAMMDVLMDKGAVSEPARLKGGKDAHSTQHDFWRNSYFKNHANKNTLQRLADGGVLTQKEVDGIVSDRIEKFGE